MDESEKPEGGKKKRKFFPELLEFLNGPPPEGGRTPLVHIGKFPGAEKIDKGMSLQDKTRKLVDFLIASRVDLISTKAIVSIRKALVRFLGERYKGIVRVVDGCKSYIQISSWTFQLKFVGIPPTADNLNYLPRQKYDICVFYTRVMLKLVPSEKLSKRRRLAEAKVALS